MEQVYYTQCPIGYGLGASNGFQIKRMSPGYPQGADFRHLGMRAFLAGSRILAPSVLRYRRAEDDGAAEVCWLTPRSHEYETERGTWGRPGGHFAHGLRFDAAEMATLHQWPGGLFGQTFWRRTDPEPTLGNPPEPLELAREWLQAEPSFETAAGFMSRLAVSATWLATLWTALADALHAGQSLIVIERPDRLGDLFALLTLGIPERGRAAVTFSTYHDRPEEQAGFRLLGTAPDPRLNRSALRALGFVADAQGQTIEPFVEPAAWALGLAAGLERRSSADREAWSLLNSLGGSEVTPEFWSRENLNRLFDLPAQVQRDPPAPATDDEWRQIEDRERWARDVGLGEPFARVRSASWWRANPGRSDAARLAFLGHLALSESWRVLAPERAWGRAGAAWLERCPRERRTAFLSGLATAAPEAARGGVIKTALTHCAPEAATEGVRWLRRQPGLDRLFLLPLEAREAVARATRHGSPEPIREVIAEAIRVEKTLVEVLDVIARETEGHLEPRSIATLALGQILGRANDPAMRILLRWVLSRDDDGRAWLEPFARAVFTSRDAIERWGHLFTLVEPSAHGGFARVSIALGLDLTEPGTFVPWCVESLVLALPERERPHDPLWPGVYVDQIPSELELMRCLVAREFRARGVPAWIEAARDRGELSRAQCDRIDRCLRFARALREGDARALMQLELPKVPPTSRGALLAQIFRRVGHTDEATRHALEACRTAWPGGFAAGAEGLTEIAAVIAERIGAASDSPAALLANLTSVAGQLGLLDAGNPETGHEPDGLIAEAIAAIAHEGTSDTLAWSVRTYVLRQDHAWKALAADVRRSIAEHSVDETLAILDRWDRHVGKGLHTDRFFEVWLNQCDGEALAAVVETRASDLRTLGRLAWWRHGELADTRDDLRDAFARRAPMAPLDEDCLTSVQAWIRPRPRGPEPVRPDDRPIPVEAEEDPRSPAAASQPDDARLTVLSDLGEARWRCIEALSTFHRRGIGTDARWLMIEDWTRHRQVWLTAIETTERYQFLAWLIARLDASDSLKILKLANWLLRHGMTDPERVNQWAEELEGLTEVPAALRLARAPMVAELRSEWRTLLREARERGAKTRESGFAGNDSLS